MTKFIAVVADTRVGSTALGTGLDNGSTIQFLGEVLYPEEIESPRHLYGHILRSNFRRMATDRACAFEVLDQFFNAGHWAPHATYIADIKYHDLRLIPEHPWGVLSRPILLDYLSKRGIATIHLNRRNKISAALSAYVAMSTNVFHIKEASREAASVEIDPSMLASEIAARERSHFQVSQWLRNDPHVFELDYETLFSDSGKEVIDTILRDRWAIAEVDFNPRLKKLSSTGRVTVSNANDLQSALGANLSPDHVISALAPYRPA